MKDRKSFQRRHFTCSIVIYMIIFVVIIFWVSKMYRYWVDLDSVYVITMKARRKDVRTNVI